VVGERGTITRDTFTVNSKYYLRESGSHEPASCFRWLSARSFDCIVKSNGVGSIEAAFPWSAASFFVGFLRPLSCLPCVAGNLQLLLLHVIDLFEFLGYKKKRAI